MNIGIDATPISLNGKGLSRFLVGLVRAIAEYGASHQFTVFINENTERPPLPQASHLLYVCVSINSSLKWDLIDLPGHLANKNVDCFISCSDRLPIFTRVPTLLYLFELPNLRHKLHKTTSSMYARVSAFITEIWFPLSIRRSRAIVTSSHATKSSLRAFRTKADICAVYPGLDEKFSDIQEAQSTYCLNLPSSYILHFSSKIDPRDNTATAIRAFHLSKQMIHHNHKLVIAGKTDPVSQGLVALVEQLGVQDDIIWAGYVPEENLVEIYRRASIYLDPSLYEGFGYQVAEAMVCGTPVVCSNVTSLPELVGDAGITCDPHDDSGIAHAISEVLSSEELQTKMRLAGYKQVTMLSWSNLVTELLSIAENSVCD